MLHVFLNSLFKSTPVCTLPSFSGGEGMEGGIATPAGPLEALPSDATIWLPSRPFSLPWVVVGTDGVLLERFLNNSLLVVLLLLLDREFRALGLGFFGVDLDDLAVWFVEIAAPAARVAGAAN